MSQTQSELQWGWLAGLMYPAVSALKMVSTEYLVKHQSVSPFQVLFVSSVGAFFFVALCASLHERIANELKLAAMAALKPPAFDYKWRALLCTCCMGDLAFMCLFFAQKTVTSAEAFCVDANFAQLLTPFAVYFAFAETQSKSIALAAILASAGGLLVVQPEFVFSDKHSLAVAGAVFSALSGALSVFRNVCVQRIEEDFSKTTLILGFFVVCAVVFSALLCTAMLVFPVSDVWRNPLQMNTLTVVILLSQSGLFLLEIAMKTWALVGLGANKFTITQQLVIVDCALLQLQLLGESENTFGYCGIALTILGCVVLPLADAFDDKHVAADNEEDYEVICDKPPSV